MPFSSRILMTIAAMILVAPFVFLFGMLCVSKFRGNQDTMSEPEAELNRSIQAENSNIASSGQPGVAGSMTETWICLFSRFGDYATVGGHEKLGIPGLLVALCLLGLTLYCIWCPQRG
jgi:hypothetical protein